MTEEIKKEDLVLVRDMRVSDMNFIFSTFLRGLYYGDSWFSEIPKDIFMKNYHQVIEKILNSPKVQVKVACLKDDDEVILGYSLLSKDDTKCHFVFVKNAWRKIGIAKSLVPQTVNTATHSTTLGLSLIKKKGWLFNPFALE